MNRSHSNLGLGALALIPLTCCLGLPLVAAVGGAALAAWVVGTIAGALVLVAAVAAIAVHACRSDGRLPFSRSRT